MKHPIRNQILHRGLLFLRAIARRVPLSFGRRIGRFLGSLAWRILRRERRKAVRHLERAFYAMPETRREEIGRANFRHLGASLFELAWLPNLDVSALEATTRWEGLEHFRHAVDQQRGVVLFTGHCGNWEWMAASIALAGFRMNVIAREMDDPRFNEFIVGSRAHFGVQTIGRGSNASAREILKTLREGAVLGVLIDQNIRAESVLLPFLGAPAPTPSGPARLAIRSGAMAIAGFIERRGDGQHIRFEPPVDTREVTDPTELTRIMSEAIERQIVRVPEQWVWMHDRWRERGGQIQP